MKFSLLTKSLHPFIAVIFDVGSSSVSVAVTEYKEGKRPHVLYSTREPIATPHTSKEEIPMKGMLSALLVVSMRVQSEALPQLGTRGNFNVDGVYCVLSSLWYDSHLTTLSSSTPRPEVISHQHVVSMLEKELEKAENAPIRKNSTVVECSATSIRLNGYHTELTKKTTAEVVDVDAYISFVNKELEEHIKKIVGKVFQLEVVRIATYPFVSTHALYALYPEKSDFLYIDISGETTDILSIHEQSIRHALSFPIGKNFFVHTLLRSRASNESDAHSLLKLLGKKSSSTENNPELDEAIGEAKKEWATSLTKALSDITQEFALPQQIFLTADDEIVDFFAKLVTVEAERINATRERRELAPKKPLRLNILTAKELSMQLSTTPDSAIEGTLGLCTIFYANARMR